MLFKHRALQISFIAGMNRIWCRLRQCGLKKNVECSKAHGKSSSDPFSIYVFLFDFHSFLHTMRTLSDANTLAHTHTFTHTIRINVRLGILLLIAHEFGIWFQCIINMECTSYVWQRSYDTKRYHISAHSLQCRAGVRIHTKTNFRIHKIFIHPCHDLKGNWILLYVCFFLVICRRLQIKYYPQQIDAKE